METRFASRTVQILLLFSLSNLLQLNQCAPSILSHSHIGSDIDSIVKTAVDKLKGLKTSIRGKIECEACKLIVGTAQSLFKEGKEWDDIANVIGDLCYVFKIEDKNVCTKIAHEFEGEVLSVFKAVALSPSEICSAYDGSTCANGYNPWHQTWTISVPGNKPPVKSVPLPKHGAPVLRILQLTDFHYDPLYTPGLSNNCKEPLCCRPPNEKGTGSTAAGYWGDYQCDPPYHTLENLMQHLKSIKDEFDWVYLTGDLPPHDVWETTRPEAINIATEIVNLFKKYLPDKIVFPTYGNHEGVPVNSFPPPFITDPDESFDWLSKPTANLWSYWLSRLPEWSQAEKTILWGGYYNMKVRDGLRVISLQTNYCNDENYWLLINSTDPAGQLQWLVKQLEQAEVKGDKVHIIGHIPAGSPDCLRSWSKNYHRIVTRFESTIIGQFFGHAHTDWFKLYFDDENNSTRATNVVYVSPGVTTYQSQNLGFRIYTIDGDYNGTTYSTLDHDSYILDLQEANEKNITNWKFEYSAKQVYGLKSLQPQDWAALVKQFQSSDDLFQKFHSYYWKSYSVPKCTATCKHTLLCDILTSVSKDHSHCNTKLVSQVSKEEIQEFRTAHKLDSC